MAANDLNGRVRDLLEREHAALLAGQLDTIARLAPERERLMGQLADSAERASLPGLRALRVMAEHNEHLLAAARRGLEAARTRLAQLRNGGPRLNTYDRQGQRVCLDATPGRLERRA